MGGPEIPEPSPPPAVRGQGLRTAIRRTFDSLDTYNYRLFFTGDLSRTSAGGCRRWPRRCWCITLTHNGAAVGATFAFRFGPVLFFGLWGGMIADRFDRRQVLLVTQSLAAVLAVGLVAGRAHRRRPGVDGVRARVRVGLRDRRRRARAAGVRRGDGRAGASCRTRSRSTARCGNSARITGPAIAALLIATVGTAWVFFGNAVSFFAVVIALVAMRKSELHRFAAVHGTTARARRARVRVVARPDPHDDRARRGGRHPRLQLPDLPHAHGDHHVSRRRRSGGLAHGVPRRRHRDRRALGRATGRGPPRARSSTTAALLGVAL